MNLEKLNLESLNTEELASIDGGRRLPKIDWKKVGDTLEKIGTYIGIADAIDRFSDGWNSVDCDCK